MTLPRAILIKKLRQLLSFNMISNGYHGMISNGYHAE